MISLGMNWWQAVLDGVHRQRRRADSDPAGGARGHALRLSVSRCSRGLWFGTRGAHFPALARAVIAAGWFGINSWFGGSALDAIVGRLAPAWLGFGPHVWVAFAIFWLLNVGIAMRGPQAIGRLALVAAPTLAVAAIALFVWGASAVHGVVDMLTAPGTIHGRRVLGGVLSVGRSASSRSGRRWRSTFPTTRATRSSQRAQLRGQLVMPLVDGALRVHRHRGDVGNGRALRKSALESGRSAADVSDRRSC